MIRNDDDDTTGCGGISAQKGEEEEEWHQCSVVGFLIRSLVFARSRLPSFLPLLSPEANVIALALARLTTSLAE